MSYEERPVDGSPSLYPMSDKPLGIIMYTPDGFMSSQLMKPARILFASETGSKERTKNTSRKRPPISPTLDSPLWMRTRKH